MEDKDLYWLAGLLEGEGSFSKGPPSQPNTPSISCQMTDEDIIKRLASLVDIGYCECKPQKEHHKVSYKVNLRGAKAVKLMMLISDLMGERRKLQIKAALKGYDPQKKAKIKDNDLEIIFERMKYERAEDIAKDYGVTKWAIYRLKDRLK